MSAIHLDNLVKKFGDFTAVDSLSFAVPEGGVFGFLGGNGAGKTTSIRMMLDILRPDSGGAARICWGSRMLEVGFRAMDTVSSTDDVSTTWVPGAKTCGPAARTAR